MEDFVLGMPHRGRLNVLANIMNKPLEDMLMEFKEVVRALSTHSLKWFSFLSAHPPSVKPLPPGTCTFDLRRSRWRTTGANQGT